MFQNYAIFPHLSVFENVAYGLRVQQKPDDEIKRAVNDVLGVVGLTGYGQQQPHQLSGGEQQRVALARAIVFRPRILCSTSRCRTSMPSCASRCEAKSGLAEAPGITTVYVTHDQEEAMAISDRIAVMEKGCWCRWKRRRTCTTIRATSSSPASSVAPTLPPRPLREAAGGSTR